MTVIIECIRWLINVTDTSLVFRRPWVQISIKRPKPKVLWLSSDSSGTYQISISKQAEQSLV